MQLNLQDGYLAQLKKENKNTVIYLVNGFQLRGRVLGYDNFTVFLENNEGRIHLVYKHAISTIAPQEEMLPTFLYESFKDFNSKRADLSKAKQSHEQNKEQETAHEGVTQPTA